MLEAIARGIQESSRGEIGKCGPQFTENVSDAVDASQNIHAMKNACITEAPHSSSDRSQAQSQTSGEIIGLSLGSEL